MAIERPGREVDLGNLDGVGPAAILASARGTSRKGDLLRRWRSSLVMTLRAQAFAEPVAQKQKLHGSRGRPSSDLVRVVHDEKSTVWAAMMALIPTLLPAPSIPVPNALLDPAPPLRF
jgi:hypothetical protein